MPREKIELTRFDARRCWKKKRNKKVFYVGKGLTDTPENKRRAWDEWKDLEAGLEAAERHERLARPVHIRRAVYETVEDRQTFIQSVAEAATNPNTIDARCKQFLALRQAFAQANPKKIGRFANIKSYVNQFADFAGRSADVSTIRGKTLADWHGKQLADVTENKIGKSGAKDKIQAAKQFVTWLWESELVELPRNIKSRNLDIAVQKKRKPPVPADALKERIIAATGRLKVELLLMANCGFTQIDCANLKQHEINWDSRTISRKRTKTDEDEKGNETQTDVPLVTYQLWPSTFALLEPYRNAKSEYVLLNDEGKKTVYAYMNDDGKPVRNDAVASSYKRLEASLETATPENYRRYTLKQIRRLAPQTLRQNKEWQMFYDYYLGHSPKGVGETSYAAPDDGLFFQALAWLGRELKLHDLADVQAPAVVESPAVASQAA
jgi:hypothetical protein